MPLDSHVVGTRKDPLQVINRINITNAVHLRSVSGSNVSSYRWRPDRLINVT
jgi:hypothetical protein